MDSFKDAGYKIGEGFGKIGNYVRKETDNILSSTTSTIEKSGLSDAFKKLYNRQLLDDIDLSKIIVLLFALIVILVVVFFLPKLNKSARLEKKILDNKIIKVLICCVLLYAFYHYDIESFLILLTVVFALFWFHHGYSQENYGPIQMYQVGSKLNDDFVKEEEEIKENDDEEKDKQQKEQIIEQIREKPFQYDNLDEYDRQEEIFDQRDFMIMSNPSKSSNQEIFERLYDEKLISKPELIKSQE